MEAWGRLDDGTATQQALGPLVTPVPRMNRGAPTEGRRSLHLLRQGQFPRPACVSLRWMGRPARRVGRWIQERAEETSDMRDRLEQTIGPEGER